jgi:hypothetical protein
LLDAASRSEHRAGGAHRRPTGSLRTEDLGSVVPFQVFSGAVSTLAWACPGLADADGINEKRTQASVGHGTPVFVSECGAGKYARTRPPFRRLAICTSF